MPKVSIVRCSDYNTENVCNAVKRSVDLLGGIAGYIKPGMRVLLKPNLLSARVPSDAVDTHPEVVRAAARIVKELSATPIIGDSPGGFGKNIDEVFEKSGMKAMADEEGVELVKFTSSRSIDGIPISRQVFDCDYFISIPKLKTHCITILTAALKNTYGTVTGLYKAECHSRAPREEEFAKIIAKVHSISKPNLNILDAIVAMEGDGPSSGEPRQMNMVMASFDGVAMDSAAAVTVGLSPLDILVTKDSYEMGLGEADLSKIELVGDSITDFIVEDFKLPQTIPTKIVPRGIAERLGSLVSFRLSIDNAICRRCNLCKITCPVAAINTNNGNCTIDYKKCVRCMCCHEVCPYRAITIKRNILTRLIWG